jgi:hypothetical protein
MAYSTQEAPNGYCRGVWEAGVRAQVPWKHKNINFVPYDRTGLKVTRITVNENIRGPNMCQQLRAEAKALKDRLYLESLDDVEREAHIAQTAMGYHTDVKESTYRKSFEQPGSENYVKHIPFQSNAAAKVFSTMNKVMLDDLRSKQDHEQNVREYNRRQKYLEEGKNDYLLQMQQPSFSSDYWAKKSGPVSPSGALMEPPVYQTQRPKSNPSPLKNTGISVAAGIPTQTKNSFDRVYGYQGSLTGEKQPGNQRIGRILTHSPIGRITEPWPIQTRDNP